MESFMCEVAAFNDMLRLMKHAFLAAVTKPISQMLARNLVSSLNFTQGYYRLLTSLANRKASFKEKKKLVFETIDGPQNSGGDYEQCLEEWCLMRELSEHGQVSERRN